MRPGNRIQYFNSEARVLEYIKTGGNDWDHDATREVVGQLEDWTLYHLIQYFNSEPRVLEYIKTEESDWGHYFSDDSLG